MSALSEENASIRSELQLLRKEYAEVKGECNEVKRTMDAVAALSMLGKEVVFEKDKKHEDSALSALKSQLASIAPAQQKDFLGKKLFPKIEALQLELAGNITGMILEMENSDLVNL